MIHLEVPSQGEHAPNNHKKEKAPPYNLNLNSKSILDEIMLKIIKASLLEV